ncbi:unnamed protein product [Mycena citricolor]|uniref:Inositol polyphosphate-related phosphatase domain-containing protein n=1 Tax=Mycena citricolor TaxID=2018698 RepID=A0AAD2JVT4_9AGAR|nr:unnamed protein product [Mycena citricolor]
MESAESSIETESLPAVKNLRSKFEQLSNRPSPIGLGLPSNHVPRPRATSGSHSSGDRPPNSPTLRSTSSSSELLSRKPPPPPPPSRARAPSPAASPSLRPASVGIDIPEAPLNLQPTEPISSPFLSPPEIHVPDAQSSPGVSALRSRNAPSPSPSPSPLRPSNSLRRPPPPRPPAQHAFLGEMEETSSPLPLSSEDESEIITSLANTTAPSLPARRPISYQQPSSSQESDVVRRIPPPRPPRTAKSVDSTVKGAEFIVKAPPLPTRRSPEDAVGPPVPNLVPPRLPMRPASVIPAIEPEERKTLSRLPPPPTRTIALGDKLPPVKRPSSPSSEEESADEGPPDLPDSSRSSRKPPHLLFRAGQNDLKITVPAHSGLVIVSGTRIVTATNHHIKIYDVAQSDTPVISLEKREIGHSQGLKELRPTSMEYRTCGRPGDRGFLLWIGTKDGHLVELDVRTGVVTAAKIGAHLHPIVRIFRHGRSMITMDDAGKTLLFAPSDDGEDIQLAFTPPRVTRVTEKQDFAQLICGKLWTASRVDLHGSRLQTIRVYDLFAPGAPFRAVAPTEAIGAITDATMLPSTPGIVYAAHEAGSVSLWKLDQDGWPQCIDIVRVAISDVLCIEGVNNRLWAGARNGAISAYDVSVKPWVITNCWMAHTKLPVKQLSVDHYGIEKTGRLCVTSVGRDEHVKLWDGLLAFDWIDIELMKREASFSTFRDLSVLIISWNCDSAKPESLTGDAANINFLHDALTSVGCPDIICFGFQELVDLESRRLVAKNVLLGRKDKQDVSVAQITGLSGLSDKVSTSYRKWYEHLVHAVRLAMPAQVPYTAIHTESLVGLFSCVFVKNSERTSIKDNVITSMKRGMGGRYGNKGGIITRLVIEDSSICFINCHLAAGQHATRARNADIGAMLEERSLLPESEHEPLAYVGGGDGQMALDHEIVFINGDMNYRIDLRRDNIITAVRANDLDSILPHDQLLKEIKYNRGCRLRGFAEGPLTFAPTYKYDRHTDVYDTSEKARAPAWCDRVLWRTRSPNRVKQLHYQRYEASVSDHRPISAAFKVTVKTIHQDVRQKAKAETELQWAVEQERLLSVSPYHHVASHPNDVTVEEHPVITYESASCDSDPVLHLRSASACITSPKNRARRDRRNRAGGFGSQVTGPSATPHRLLDLLRAPDPIRTGHYETKITWKGHSERVRHLHGCNKVHFGWEFGRNIEADAVFRPNDPSAIFHDALRNNKAVVCALSASYISTFAGYPLDSLKSRLQTQRVPISVPKLAALVYREEGITGFYRGLWIPLLTISFVRAASFTIYTETKEYFRVNHYLDRDRILDAALAGGIGGAMSGSLISFGSAPFELVKVRRQLEYAIAASKGQHLVKPPGTAAAVRLVILLYLLTIPGDAFPREIFKANGVRGLYTGFRLHFLRDTLGTGLYFFEYDGMRHLLGRHRNGEQGSTPSWLPVHASLVPFVCGSVSGVTSWALIYPLDVVKTKMQQRALAGERYRSVGETFFRLIRGAIDFFSQVSPDSKETGPDPSAPKSFLEGCARIYRGLGRSPRNMSFSELLGYTSIACWLGAQFPQLLENIRLQSCEGLALPFLANWLLGDIANLTGCLLTEQLPFQTYLATYFVFVDMILFSQYFYYGGGKTVSTFGRGRRTSAAADRHYRTLSVVAANMSTAAALAAQAHENTRRSIDRMSASMLSDDVPEGAMLGMADSFHSERAASKKRVSWSTERHGRGGSVGRTPMPRGVFTPRTGTEEEGTFRGRSLQRDLQASERDDVVPSSVDSQRKSSRASKRGANLVFLSVMAMFGMRAWSGNLAPGGIMLRKDLADSGHVLADVPAIIQDLSSSEAVHVYFPVADDPTHHEPEPTNPSNERLIGRVSAWLCTTLYLTSRLPQIWKNYVRKSVEGLAISLFVCAFLGNSFYVASILTSDQVFLPAPQSTDFLLESLPYLLGSGGTLTFDIIIDQWRTTTTRASLLEDHYPPFLFSAMSRPSSRRDAPNSPRSSISSNDKRSQHTTELPELPSAQPASAPHVTKPSLRLLFSLIPPRQRALLLIPAIVSSLVAGAIAPFMTLVVGQAFNAFARFDQSLPANQASKDRLMHSMTVSALELVGLAVGSVLLSSLMSSLWIWTGEQNVRAVRRRIYSAVTQKDMVWFDAKMGTEGTQGEDEGPIGAGGMMAKFARETDEVREASSLAAGRLIQYLTTCIACLALGFMRSWSLTLVILTAVPVLVCIQIASQLLAGPLLNVERSTTAVAATHVDRAFSAISTVKAFNASGYEQHKLDGALDKMSTATRKLVAVWGVTSGCAQFVMMGMFVQAFWFGSKLVKEGKIGPGDVMAVFWACLIATSNLQMSIPQFIVLTRGKFAIVSLLAVVDDDGDDGFGDVPLSPTTAIPAARPVQRRTNQHLRKIQPKRCTGEFALHNISFAYPSRPHVTVLEDINLFLPAFETTFIVGSSGSGKSTIAHLLLGLYTPQAGLIELDDQDIKFIDERWRRRHVASVEQGCILFDMSVFDNVALGAGGRDVTRDEVQQACVTALMHEFVRDLPDGYDTMLGTSGASLSGGQKQRLAIARARLRDPTVLILDEATSALDPTSRILVFEAIKRWRKNKTTIVITHDLSQITSSDFVYVLKDGHVAEQGFRYDLEVSGGEFSEMMISQGATGGYLPEKQVDSAMRTYTPTSEDEDKTELTHPSVGVTTTFGWMFDVVTDLTTVPLAFPTAAETFEDDEPSVSEKVAVTRSRRPSSVYEHPVSPLPLMTRDSRRFSLQFSPTSTTFNFPTADEPEKWIEFDEKELESRGERASRRRRASQPRKARTRWEDSKALDVQVEKPSEDVSAQPEISVWRLVKDIYPTVPYKPLLVFGLVVCLISGAITPLFSFLLSQLFYEVANGAKDTAMINKYGAIVLCTAALDGIFIGLKYFIMESTSMLWITHLRKVCFKLVLAQDKKWFDKSDNSPVRLVQVLIKDGDDARNLIAVVLGQLAVVTSMLGVGLVWALVKGWQLTLVGFAIAPVFAVAMAVQTGLVAKCEARNKHAREQVAKGYYESILNVRAIRSMGFEAIFQKQFEASTDTALRAGVRGAFVEGCTYGVASGLIYLAEALLFYVGAVLIAHGTYSYLQMVQVLNLVVFTVTLGSQVMAFTQKIAQSVQATRGFNEMLHLPTQTDESAGIICPPLDGPITLQNVDFSYPGRPDVPVLRETNLQIDPGECVAVVGASGSGKSTIAALLQRLYEPQNGRIFVGLDELKTMNVVHLRHHISVVSQNPNLFDATVAENIAYGNADLPFADIRRAAQAANVHDFIMSLPQGYDTMVGENASLISGGQAQRLSIARALARPSKILILDECTSALDPANQAVVLDTVRRAKVGRTTVMVTHKLPVMQMCDRILVVHDGRIAEQGTYDQLIQRKGIFAQLASGGEWE